MKKTSTKTKKKINKKQLKTSILSIIIIGLIVVASSCLAFALYIIITAPEFDTEKLYTKEASILYDKKGVEFARIGKENRELVTYEDLPQVFIDALIATEDSRFFQHNGVDIARFTKAVFYQLIGKNYGGASTLSMQLIKKNYTSSEAEGIKGIIRKFTDIYMSVFKLENVYTKEEIIEFYTNTMWFGNDGNINYTGIYGVEQASQYYFGKSVRELTLAESTLLVGMYQNPVTRNPYKYPENARSRQNTVLKLMVLHGYITEDDMKAVLAIPVESLLNDLDENTTSQEYQAVIDYVIEEVEEKTGKNPYNNSMKIYTTIDIDKQNVVRNVEIGQTYKWTREKLNFGVAVTSVADGSIVALSGGRDYKAKGLNHATDIRRQPGSTAKPLFDYAPYFEYMNGSTGDYLFDDKYSYSNGQSITNSDNSYMGMITLRSALQNSRNIPALQVFQKLMKEKDGENLVTDFVHSVGINFGKNLFESASIGGFDGVSPLQESAAYAIFGREGYYIPPYIFTKIIFEDGTTFEYKFEDTKQKVLSAESAYMIANVLRGVVTTNQCGSIKVSGSEISGKTGTTNVDSNTVKKEGLQKGAIRDSWTTTFSSEYAISLWVGYDVITKENNLTMKQANPIRSGIMGTLANGIYSKNVKFKKPKGVISVEVEKFTVPLQLPSANTPEDMRITELFKAGTEPTETSNRYETLTTPKNLNYSVSDNIVTLTWDAISIPKAIDKEYLQNYFNENYGTFASKYYEKRIEENNTQFGELGYNVYVENNGVLSLITWVSSTKYSQSIEYNKDYKFVVKAAYKLFNANESSGISTNVNIVKTEPTPTPQDPTTPPTPPTPTPNPNEPTSDLTE